MASATIGPMPASNSVAISAIHNYLVNLEFNGPVYAIKVMSIQSVYLTTLFLCRLSPLSG